MWDFIINPFITILTMLYSVMGNNTVLAIAVLTVVIRLATSPLLLQQQRSTRAMQELQPRLKALQEKYKNDREKLAQEQMALYKEHGVNPLGGCLPLLIQFPILISLYGTIIIALASTPYQLVDLSGRLLIPGLDNLVPLNHVWLDMDLTLPPTANPTYALLLPLLVMVTSWMQSKLTIPPPPPSTDGQPNQAAQMTRMMTTIMPLMFGFFSLSFMVGLSIYFVVGNLVGILQSTLMGRAEWGRLIGREPEKKPEEVKEGATLVAARAGGGSDEAGNSKPAPRPAPKAAPAKSAAKSSGSAAKPKPKPRPKPKSRKKAKAK